MRQIILTYFKEKGKALIFESLHVFKAIKFN